MIETRQLKHFAALAEHLSFARASRVVHLSQSAFSRSIRSLESTLGVTLIARDKRHVELTNAGLMFVQQAKEILFRTAELQRQVELLRGGSRGVLRAGAGPYPADLFVGDAVGRLLAAHPGLQVNLEVGDWTTLRHHLKSRSIEFFIGETTDLVDDPELHLDVMKQHQGYFVVRKGHPLTKLRNLSLKDVIPYPLAVVGRLASRFTTALVREAVSGEKRPVLAIQSTHTPILRSLLAHCDAVSLFTLPQVEAEIRTGSLVALPLVLPWVSTQFGFVSIRNQALSPSAAEFKRIANDANEAAIQRSWNLAPLVGGGRQATQRRSEAPVR
jgi:DNA-binding transcriptional LysR family regulator